MRILHTADWHVGKVLKGHSRHEEHRAVLASLVTTATEQDVDLVLVAGDVFEHAVPATTAQSLVLQTLVDLAGDHRQVVVIAGNHDNPRQLDVFRPLLEAVGVTVVGVPRSAADGGRLDLAARTGEQVRLGVLPFLSKRYAVSAAEAMTNTAAENNRAYADQVAAIVAAPAPAGRPGAAPPRPGRGASDGVDPYVRARVGYGPQLRGRNAEGAAAYASARTSSTWR